MSSTGEAFSRNEAISDARGRGRGRSASSIRWTLIGGYGLLLCAVITAFGAALYLEARSSTFRGIDAALTDRALAIAAALEHDDVDGWELELSDEYLRGLSSELDYAVVGPDGQVLTRGGPRSDGSAAEGEDAAAPRVVSSAWREVSVAGPEGTRVVLGRSIESDRTALSSLLLGIVVTGVATLAVGLGAGWWLASRTLAPVGALASSVAAIRPSDLSARLDVSEVPAELAPLARAFNASLAKIEEAFARQARFTADASHELRTPLAVMRTQVEVAMRAPRSPVEYRETLEACMRAIERMGGLVEALLTLARADSGNAGNGRTPVALDAVVLDQAEFLRPLAQAAEIQLDCALAPAQVRGDPRLLGDAVRNLIDNGVRYNRRGGRVDVLLESEGASAVLSVRDTGQGIPAQAQDRVFERFYRVDDARSRDKGGAGLGLAIVRSIVEAHGGSVSLESRAGEGSTFTVRLPAASTVS